MESGNKVARHFDLEEYLWDCHSSVCETCANCPTGDKTCRKIQECHWITNGDPEDDNWIPSEYEDTE
jgi:hypothetical protein